MTRADLIAAIARRLPRLISSKHLGRSYLVDFKSRLRYLTMNKFRIIFSLLGVLCCASALAQSIGLAPNAKIQTSPYVPPGPAGKIDLIEGEVRIVQAGKQPQRAVLGDAVNEGDILVTGKDSEVHVTMQDSGFIALRPNTRLKIVSYRADGGDEDKGVFSLIAGGLRSVTGWIGKFNQKSYQVRTQTATIGIRGTDHETRFIPEGSSEGEPGTYDKVFVGETTIQTDAGQVKVDANQAGFVSSMAGQPPHVLGRIPEFFRPGPHEDLINKKHAEIQKMIEQRREDRRKVITEKLAALNAARVEMNAQKEKNKAAAAERVAAEEKQNQDTDEQLAALREREKVLQEKQKAIQEMRKAIQQKTAGDLMKNTTLREQLMGVYEAGKAIRDEYKEIQDLRKALSESNTALTEARKAEAEVQRRKNEEQLAVLSERGRSLQDKQKAIQKLHEAMQDESTGKPGANENFNERRKSVREATEAANKEQREIRETQNAIVENALVAAESRMVAARKQRYDTEEQRAALNKKEEALQEKQKANEEKLEAIQESGASESGKKESLRQLLAVVRESATFVRNERKEIRNARKAIQAKNMASIDERQQVAMEQLIVIREKHREIYAKGLDLQNEREAMQEEIRTLFEQEQKRYHEELKADRQLRTTPNTSVDAGQ